MKTKCHQSAYGLEECSGCTASTSAARLLLQVCGRLHLVEAADRALEGKLHSTSSMKRHERLRQQILPWSHHLTIACEGQWHWGSAVCRKKDCLAVAASHCNSLWCGDQQNTCSSRPPSRAIRGCACCAPPPTGATPPADMTSRRRRPPADQWRNSFNITTAGCLGYHANSTFRCTQRMAICMLLTAGYLQLPTRTAGPPGPRAAPHSRRPQTRCPAPQQHCTPGGGNIQTSLQAQWAFLSIATDSVRVVAHQLDVRIIQFINERDEPSRLITRLQCTKFVCHTEWITVLDAQGGQTKFLQFQQSALRAQSLHE